MEEVYTCSCDSQEWMVLSNRVQCIKCKKYYNFDDLIISNITSYVNDFIVMPTPRIFNFAIDGK